MNNEVKTKLLAMLKQNEYVIAELSSKLHELTIRQQNILLLLMEDEENNA
jgi:hypothetical protein